MKTAQSIKVGIFFICGVVLLYIVYETLGTGTANTRSTYTVAAPFENLRQLKPSDEVRMAGVRIGTVGATRLTEENTALAELRIEEQYRIPADSVASISTSGLLGNNYVSITPGKATASLAAGGTIGTRATPSINEVISDIGSIAGKVDRLVTGLDESLGGLAGEDGEQPAFLGSLDALIDENRTRIRAITTNLQQVSADLAQGKGSLGRLINDPEAYQRLLDAAREIETAARNVSALTGDAESLVADVRAGNGALGVLLYDETAASDLRQAIANVNAFTTRLNREDTTLGRLISDDALYNQASRTLDEVENAVGGIDDTGPVTAVGVVSGALF